MRTRQTIRASTLERHTHRAAYAALILKGSYEEAGDNGRFLVEAGDVLFHDCFEAHVDRFAATGAVVFNLPLLVEHSVTPGAARISDPDIVLTTAERDRTEAVNVLLSVIEQRRSGPADWPEELAAALMENPSVKLSRWAEQHQLPPWTVSRGFTQVFGTSPEAFRARTRARQAWKAIQTSTESLAQIALRFGFADQSHMSRSVKDVTGMAPHAWRVAANGFKTEEDCRV